MKLGLTFGCHREELWEMNTSTPIASGMSQDLINKIREDQLKSSSKELHIPVAESPINGEKNINKTSSPTSHQSEIEALVLDPSPYQSVFANSLSNGNRSTALPPPHYTDVSPLPTINTTHYKYEHFFPPFGGQSTPLAE